MKLIVKDNPATSRIMIAIWRMVIAWRLLMVTGLG